MSCCWGRFKGAGRWRRGRGGSSVPVWGVRWRDVAGGVEEALMVVEKGERRGLAELGSASKCVILLLVSRFLVGG